MSGQVGLACDVWVSIRKPDGSTLVADTCMETSGFIDTKVLPAAGDYTVVINPDSWAVGSLTLTLYDVPADVGGTLSIGASPTGVTLATPGQNAAMTFTATTGQQVTVRMTGNTIGTTLVRLLKPDGSQQTSATSSSTNFNLATQTLAAGGAYTVVIDPSGTRTGSINVAVTSP